ncbi:hypothetical protein [Nodularia spumigena]|uniref:hypothetical protein n=1 Tax=Nodularia spumigena TaxID=70799 RepID=UPI00232FFE1A|nr:hypothetical protein [Nodularia spumigena]MDB9317052.1 hypothetical protein [Nodularia spumigena CS-590/01A]MDB9320783.1 hypothetical protein [Nodularia spumigena CS-591/07A]MDB9327619.1 hypothetical protein [Nodularia spumigena CS-590/02]MDB9329339.1 hypothetical protein [Nodularia spumigena CS-591/04]MDB9337562.1 hypothetical protein [Nodularia spumigena CS-590/01]
MSEEQKQKNNNKETTPSASGGYQTPVEPGIRKTGNAAQTEAQEGAKPEAPGEDTVGGSPNQGTESR